MHIYIVERRIKFGFKRVIGGRVAAKSDVLLIKDWNLDDQVNRAF